MQAKKSFYQNFISDLKIKDPSSWYSSLKRITSYDPHKKDKLIVSDISHMTQNQQAEAMASKFAEVQNQYEPINLDEIKFPNFSEADIPNFSCNQVWIELSKLKTKKSSIKGDIPPKILRNIAAYIAEPLTHILNESIRKGEYPNIFKHKIIT